MLQLIDITTAPIDEYAAIIGEAEVERLRDLAARLKGAKITHINATPYGGGVSELLRSTIAIQRGLGLDIEWRVISGDQHFFEVTKGFHNALQGGDYHLTSEAQQTYLLQNSYNARQYQDGADFVVIHDPQPAAMLHMHGHDGGRWVWRCHIDTSQPNQAVLDFLLPYLTDYDALVFTLDSFVPPALRDTGIPTAIIPPAIDPLSPKNMDLPDLLSRQIMHWLGVDHQRPLLTQVSRFDPWKDPLGVVRVYKRARDEVPGLQLALLGSMATDDPEAWGLLDAIRAETEGDDDITVATNLTGVGNIEVNVFQRRSDVVLQKSLREGFGLIVSETLWKGTPVVAGATGGIPMQMPDGAGGYLVDPQDEDAVAERIVYLLRHPDEARRLGARGREVVRERFLITRMIADELELLLDIAGRPRHHRPDTDTGTREAARG